MFNVREIHRERSDRWGLARTANHIGSTLISMGRFEEAISNFHESLALIDGLAGMESTRASAYVGLAAAVSLNGDLAEGRKLFSIAKALNTDLADQANLAHADLTEGETLIRLGLAEEGEALTRKGIEAFDAQGGLNGVPADEVIAGRLARIRDQVAKQKNQN